MVFIIISDFRFGDTALTATDPQVLLRKQWFHINYHREIVVKIPKIYVYICKLLRLNSEDPQLVPPLVLDIFIDGEEKHVGKEDAEAAEEVPDVVEVVEVKEAAGLVQVPRLRGRQIGVLLGL